MPDPAMPLNEHDGTVGLKLAALRRELARAGPVLVSFSGGLDSSLLAVVARAVLGDRAVCAFLDSPLVPRSAVAEARAIAGEHGLSLVVIPFDPLSDPAIANNSSERCYHCKKAIAAVLKREAAPLGISAIVDGVTCSDLAEYRPGLRACAEAGIEHPFVAAGITKPEVRAIARSLGLSFADKPSAACLASRIPYGDTLTPVRLAMVERAEEALRSLGFPQGRVRGHGLLARVEVPAEALARAIKAAPGLVSLIKAAGFAYVTLDLEGYRSGAMDEVVGDRRK